MDPPHSFTPRLSNAISRLLRGPTRSPVSHGATDPTPNGFLDHEHENHTSPLPSLCKYTEKREKDLSSPTPVRCALDRDAVTRYQEKMEQADQHRYAEFIREYPGRYCSACTSLMIH